MLVGEFIERVNELGRLHPMLMQHRLNGIQPLLNAGHGWVVLGHASSLRECLRIMLTATH